MHRLVAILLFCLSTVMVFAQASTVSRSGQFIVKGVEPGRARPFVPEVTGNKKFARLEPALVAVSCERIKQTLLAALGEPDQWRGKVFVVIHPAREIDEGIEVAATRYADTWNYEVSMPDPVDPQRLVRTLTQVLLVEMANRALPPQSATLPVWLAEGMPQYLMAVSDVDLVLKPASEAARGGNTVPERLDQREGRYLSPFAKARQHLREQPPLTIQQLGDPGPGQLDGEEGRVYRDTALFLIDELLKLKNGGQCLVAMLPELPWDPDWRVGFLKAFKQHFTRMKDFEKWWALQSAYFMARDSNQVWPRAESINKLQEVLRTPFAVQLGSNQPPLYTDVSLQAIIKGWKLEQQLPVLREKLTLLDQLQMRMAPDLHPLLKQYRELLQKYVTKQDFTPVRAPEPFGKHPLAVARPIKQTRAPDAKSPIVKQTVEQLDLCDTRLQAWRFAPEKPAQVQTSQPFKAQ